MPAQRRDNAEASDAGRAEVASLSSCAGIGHPQTRAGCLLQEKLDATMSNVKPCEVIIQTLLQFCTNPSMGLLLPVLHFAHFLRAACFSNTHTADLEESASTGNESVTLNHLPLSPTKPLQPWTIEQRILCCLCCPKGYISKPEMYGLGELTTIHSAQAV